MSTTNIEWADATWNPVVGCSPVSPGCLNCYAATMARRLQCMGKDGYVSRPAGTFTVEEARANPNLVMRIAEVHNGRAVFTGDVRLLPGRLVDPLRWRKPRRIFVCSMSDLFHDAVPFEFIDRVFAVAALCRQHQFLVLTKRPERMAEYLHHQDPGRIGWLANGMAMETPARWANAVASHGLNSAVPYPLPNVWLGTSCEDQQRADERIPHLLRCPASVRFLSCEPLLGPIDLTGIDRGDGGPPTAFVFNRDGSPRGIGWVIVGGESGAKARPCDIGWVRSLVGQCQAASVPVFVKQLGAQPHNLGDGSEQPNAGTLLDSITDRKGGNPAEWPEDLRVREMPCGEAVTS